jgi:hypothetical protein
MLRHKLMVPTNRHHHIHCPQEISFFSVGISLVSTSNGRQGFPNDTFLLVGDLSSSFQGFWYRRFLQSNSDHFRLEHDVTKEVVVGVELLAVFNVEVVVVWHVGHRKMTDAIK